MDPKWEIRRNPDGSIDEIVAEGCVVHLEQMSGKGWYLGIYADHSPAASLLQVDIYSKSRVHVVDKFGPDEYPAPPTQGMYSIDWSRLGEPLTQLKTPFLDAIRSGSYKLHTTFKEDADGKLGIGELSICPEDCPDGPNQQSHPLTLAEPRGYYHGCNCTEGYECRQDGCPCMCHVRMFI